MFRLLCDAEGPEVVVDVRDFLKKSGLAPIPISAGMKFHFSSSQPGGGSITLETDPAGDSEKSPACHFVLSATQQDGSREFIAGLRFPLDAEELDDANVVFDEGTRLPVEDVEESLHQAAGMIRSMVAVSRHA